MNNDITKCPRFVDWSTGIRYENANPASAGLPYTATEDCYFIDHTYAAGTKPSWIIKINGVNAIEVIPPGNGSTSIETRGWASCYLLKGDIVNIIPVNGGAAGWTGLTYYAYIIYKLK